MRSRSEVPDQIDQDVVGFNKNRSRILTVLLFLFFGVLAILAFIGVKGPWFIGIVVAVLVLGFALVIRGQKCKLCKGPLRQTNRRVEKDQLHGAFDHIEKAKQPLGYSAYKAGSVRARNWRLVCWECNGCGKTAVVSVEPIRKPV